MSFFFFLSFLFSFVGHLGGNLAFYYIALATDYFFFGPFSLFNKDEVLFEIVAYQKKDFICFYL